MSLDIEAKREEPEAIDGRTAAVGFRFLSRTFAVPHITGKRISKAAHLIGLIGGGTFSGTHLLLN